jgi:hypothetical protein
VTEFTKEQRSTLYTFFEAPSVFFAKKCLISVFSSSTISNRDTKVEKKMKRARRASDRNAAVCSKCGKEKPEGGICRPCQLAYARAAYSKSKEVRQVAAREGYVARREYILKKRVADYRRNKADVLAKRAAVRARLARSLRSLLKVVVVGPLMFNSAWIRKARVRHNGTVNSVLLASKLYTIQAGRCACCDRKLAGRFRLDHIIPPAMGGTDAESNFQLLLPACDTLKGQGSPIVFMREHRSESMQKAWATNLKERREVFGF